MSQVAPETAGSGIPHLKAVLYRLRSMRWQRIVPVKFLAGVFAVGAAVTERLKESPREPQTMRLGGAGVGMAAYFAAIVSAPLRASCLLWR